MPVIPTFRKKIGQSVLGHPIWANSNFDLNKTTSGPFTMVIGGIHGDEPTTAILLRRFISHCLKTDKSIGNACVIPKANPDGLYSNSRLNAGNVDINRNFPRRLESPAPSNSGRFPLSEPETKALHQFVLDYEPARIISLHWALSEIDADGGRSLPLAKAIFQSLSKHERLLFRYKQSSYDEPGAEEFRGSLGQWCGYELQYKDKKRPAMVTIELPYTHHAGKGLHPLPAGHWNQALKTWADEPKQYIEAIAPIIFKMIKTACAG